MSNGIERGPSATFLEKTHFCRLAGADMQHRLCSTAGVAFMANPGDWLRGLREELHLTRIAIERLTSEAASRANNERYRIRRGRPPPPPGRHAVAAHFAGQGRL